MSFTLKGLFSSSRSIANDTDKNKYETINEQVISYNIITYNINHIKLILNTYNISWILRLKNQNQNVMMLHL